MAVLPILRWPDPRLRVRCDAVEEVTDEIRTAAADMLQTMYAATGRGLAGPQVGVMRRIFVMDVAWKDGTPEPVLLLNPDILWAADQRATGPEGCLSIPGLAPRITRPAEIRLRWMDLDSDVHERHLAGFAAICAQHEIDHLDGIVTFDRLSPEARAAAEKEYLG